MRIGIRVLILHYDEICVVSHQRIMEVVLTENLNGLQAGPGLLLTPSPAPHQAPLLRSETPGAQKPHCSPQHLPHVAADVEQPVPS